MLILKYVIQAHFMTFLICSVGAKKYLHFSFSFIFS